MKKKFLLLSSVVLLLAVFLSSFQTTRRISGAKNGSDTSLLPLFALAKDLQGKNKRSENGLISLTTGLDNNFYLLDSTSRTGYLYLETSMKRFVNEAVRKVPLNISIVLDRSGSMAGEKMDFAKKAANGIIDRLSPDDYVSVVIYDEFIDVIQTATPVKYKDSIKARIAKIKPRGSTNLWGGSERGYEQVQANFKKDYINRVLLISDGLITAGPKIPSRIIAKVQEYKDIQGISISTFGVGLDYNETLMTDMAENGAGNYYYIDRADKMEAMFNKELNGLLNVLAQNAELTITLPRGITVEKIYPFKYGLDKNEITIRFRDLFSEEVKSMILQFRLDDRANKDLLLQAKLTYTDVRDHEQKTLLLENLLQPTKDIAAYRTQFNKTVAEQVVLFTANENMERTMLEVDKGNYELAAKYAAANGSFLSTNAAYVKGSRELQRMDSITRFYFDDIAKAKTMSKDSVKQMQKARRDANYQIRNKKQ